MRSGWQQSTRKPIHLYGNAPVGGSRADQHTSQRNTRYTHAATLGPAPQQPKNRVFDRLSAAGGHTWGSPANSPAAAIAGARAVERDPSAHARFATFAPIATQRGGPRAKRRLPRGNCTLWWAHRPARARARARLWRFPLRKAETTTNGAKLPPCGANRRWAVAPIGAGRWRQSAVGGGANRRWAVGGGANRRWGWRQSALGGGQLSRCRSILRGHQGRGRARPVDRKVRGRRLRHHVPTVPGVIQPKPRQE